MRSQLLDRRRSNRAVSPVIGVILMVAITVILAAVIGAFVLEIGDQQETAPSTSFDSEENTVYYKYVGTGSLCVPNCEADIGQVVFSHAGGDTIDVTSARISVTGSGGAWGLADENPGDDAADGVKPQPDIRPTLGSNEQEELASGEQLNVVGISERRNSETVKNREYDSWGYPLEESGGTCCSSGGDSITQGHARLWLDDGASSWQTDDSGNPRYPNPSISPNNGRDAPALPLLEEGDTVRLVWEAESGGKSQQLFEYTVQTGTKADQLQFD